MIDYDRLLVLDKGELVEFDTPWNLIRKEGGIFRNMCLKSGNFAELEAIARAKAESQQGVSTTGNELPVEEQVTVQDEAATAHRDEHMVEEGVTAALEEDIHNESPVPQVSQPPDETYTSVTEEVTPTPATPEAEDPKVQEDGDQPTPGEASLHLETQTTSNTEAVSEEGTGGDVPAGKEDEVPREEGDEQ